MPPAVRFKMRFKTVDDCQYNVAQFRPLSLKEKCKKHVRATQVLAPSAPRSQETKAVPAASQDGDGLLCTFCFDLGRVGAVRHGGDHPIGTVGFNEPVPPTSLGVFVVLNMPCTKLSWYLRETCWT